MSLPKINIDLPIIKSNRVPCCTDNPACLDKKIPFPLKVGLPKLLLASITTMSKGASLTKCTFKK
jgi:hypothetical protein